MPHWSLGTSRLVSASTAAKKWVAGVAWVLVGALPTEAFCLNDLWYSSTFYRLW